MNNDNPIKRMRKVSIIIPLYNKEAYIAATLESALRQTYGALEVVVVDDGSTDGSAAVVARRMEGPRGEAVRLVRQENRGLAAARNAAIAAAEGHYVVPLDADDLLEPAYVERCVAHMEAHPETRLVYARHTRVGHPDEVVRLSDYDYDTLLFFNHIPATAMFRRADFMLTPGYNPNMRHILEDWDFWLTFLRRGDVVHCIDEPLWQYRAVEGSRNSDYFRYQEEAYRQIWRNHPALYADKQDLLVLAYDNWHRYRDLYEGIKKSRAYRLGKALLKPLHALRGLGGVKRG